MHAGHLSGSARRALLPLFVLVMLLAAGCTTPEPEAAPPASSAPPADPEPPFCAAEHVKCGTVTASSGVSASYAVLSAGKPSGAGLVLVELGGPGLDLYSRADPSFVTVPERLRSYDLLMIREPWASAKAGDGCRAALRELGDSLSRATARLSAASAAECHTSGWTASAYVAAVRAALSAENRTLAGIVGQSYGALPAAEAARQWPDAWLILNAPIAAGSVRAAELLKGRDTAFRHALDTSYARTCEKIAAPCAVRGTAVVAAALARMTDHVIDERSDSLRAGDLELSVMAAAYDLGTNETWLWSVLTRLPAIGEQDWATIGRLADQLIQRSGGGGEVSPRLDAYFTGICESYAGWESVDPTDRTLSLLLRTVASQCVGRPARSARWTTSRLAQRRGAVCIYLNQEDPVVDAAHAMAWTAIFPAGVVRRYRYGGHLSLDRAVKLPASGSACTPLSGSGA